MASGCDIAAVADSSSALCADTPEHPAVVLSEQRQIIFSNEAVRIALFQLERRMKIKAPPGVIVACELAESPPMRVKLTFHNALMDEQQDIEVDENNLAAALIGYCIREHIPIPKNAEKCLKLVDGRVSLNLTIVVHGGEV